MSKIRQILRLYVQGTGTKQISAITGIARNTVKKYLHKFISLKMIYADIEAMDDHQLDTLFTPQQQAPIDDRYEQMQQLLPEITKQLKRKGVTRIQLWEAYVQQYPGGYGRSRFNNFIQDYTGRTNPAMHIEHKAGDKVFVDFAGEKLSVVFVLFHLVEQRVKNK